MTDQHPRVFWTSDRSALVEEGDARAAFLAYASADPIPDEHLALLEREARPAPAPTTQANAVRQSAIRRTRKPKA